MFCSKIGGECPHPVSIDENYVFCIMPFKNFDSVYDAIKTSIESIENKNLVCDRADKQYTNLTIWCDRICSCIRKAKYCIADTTGKNPNVFYELGFAHTTSQTKTIIITQNIEDAPFDVRDIGHIVYTEKNLPELRKKLQKAIISLEKQEEESEDIITTPDEMIMRLRKDLKNEEERSTKFKNEVIEGEKREDKLKKRIEELEKIKKEPVEEAKRRISELQGTVAELKSQLNFAMEDRGSKAVKIITLEKDLERKQDKLKEYKIELEKYVTSKDEKGLSDLMFSEEQKQIESNKWFGKGLKANNDNDKIIFYSKAIEINPEHVDAYNNRGIAHDNLKEYDKAINDFNKAIEINPENADTFYNRGAVYVNLKKYDKAIDDYNKAIEINPEHVNAYNNRGYAYVNIKKYNKAIKDYTKALEINPNNSNAFLNLIESLIIIGEYNKAIENMKYELEVSNFGQRIIKIYLECIIKKLLNYNVTDCQKKLNILIKDNVDIIWDFKPIEVWLEDTSIPNNNKEYIVQLTEKLKQKGN